MQAKLIEEKELRMLLNLKRGKRTIREQAEEITATNKSNYRSGISFQFLYRVLTKNARPGPAIQQYLGYEEVTMYRKIPRSRKKTPEASPGDAAKL